MNIIKPYSHLDIALNQLQDVLKKKEQKIQSQEQLIAQLQKENASLNLHITQLKGQAQNLEGQTQSLDREVRHLQAENEDLKSHKDSACTEIAKLKGISTSHRSKQAWAAIKDSGLMNGTICLKLHSLNEEINRIKETIEGFQGSGSLFQFHKKVAENRNIAEIEQSIQTLEQNAKESAAVIIDLGKVIAPCEEALKIEGVFLTTSEEEFKRLREDHSFISDKLNIVRNNQETFETDQRDVVNRIAKIKDSFAVVKIWKNVREIETVRMRITQKIEELETANEKDKYKNALTTLDMANKELQVAKRNLDELNIDGVRRLKLESQLEKGNKAYDDAFKSVESARVAFPILHKATEELRKLKEASLKQGVISDEPVRKVIIELQESRVLPENWKKMADPILIEAEKITRAREGRFAACSFSF